MPLFRSWGARPDATRGTSALEVRKGLAGLFAQSSAGGVGARAGVIPGDRGLVVEGTTSWAYVVWQHHVVTSRGVSDGAHLFGNDGLVQVGTGGVGTTVAAAPGTGSRIDIVWERHRAADENGDTVSEPDCGVTSGTAGTPGLAPSIPTGALELGRAVVSAGNANTAAASITQTFPRTALRGTPIPVRSEAERNTLSALASSNLPIEVIRTDKGGRRERNDGGVAGWYVPDVMPLAKVGETGGMSTSLIATGTSGTILGPSALTLDRPARVRFDVKLTMRAGANSAGYTRIKVGGVTVAERRWENHGSTAPVPADVSVVLDMPEGVTSWVVEGSVDPAGVGATPAGGQYEISW